MNIFVVVYNPLGSNKSTIVQLPVSVDQAFDIKRLDSNPMSPTTSVRPVQSRFSSELSAKYILTFDTGPLHPVGTTVFLIKSNPNKIEENVGENAEKVLVNQELETLRKLKYVGNDEDRLPVTAVNDFVSVKFYRYVCFFHGENVSFFLERISHSVFSLQFNWRYGIYNIQRHDSASVSVLGILHILRLDDGQTE